LTAADLRGSFTIMSRRWLVVAFLIPAGAASGQSLAAIVPATAPHCAVTTPPADAGIAGTPGGFVMVFP
jgi:hypothetical protein